METNLYQSKFFGKPYLPKTVEHPKDCHGKPMALLAQLNFAEIPALEYMPDHGILQFFISAEDDLHGLNFKDLTQQSNFRVLYHAEILEDESLLVTDFSYMDQLNMEDFPISRELSLSFQVAHGPISFDDFRFNKWICDLEKLDEDQIQLWNDTFSDLFYSHATGHKIGGYPYFTQEDPRKYSLSDREILLLQIDSDYNPDRKPMWDIMWGDCGVANFFIKKEDLCRLDFSNVTYYWDCT